MSRFALTAPFEAFQSDNYLALYHLINVSDYKRTNICYYIILVPPLLQLLETPPMRNGTFKIFITRFSLFSQCAQFTRQGFAYRFWHTAVFSRVSTVIRKRTQAEKVRKLN